MIVLLPASDHRPTPWKNGGGKTVEIAISPPGCGLDDFDWRISMAQVPEPGLFSVFPGCDRTLTLLAGNGLELQIGDAPPVVVDLDSQPFLFPADAPTSSRLHAGPVTDLNVMTRRDRLTHRVTRLSVDRPLDIASDAAVMFLMCHRGAIDVTHPGGALALSALDSILDTSSASRRLHLDPASPATAFLVEIDGV